MALTQSEAIEKTRKLLALANGAANEAEAAAAAARAAALMERYRLEASMLAQAEQRETVADEPFDMNDADDRLSERSHARIPTWYWTLVWGVADAHRCKPHSVWTSGRGAMAFAGRPSDAAAARYMLDALANEIDRLAVAFVARHAGKRIARSAGKSFRLGAAAVIAKRLSESAAETTSQIRGELQAAQDTAALARLDNAIAIREADGKRLDKYITAHGVTYGPSRSWEVSNEDAFRAGAKAGNGVRLQGGTAALGHGAKALPGR